MFPFFSAFIPYRRRFWCPFKPPCYFRNMIRYNPRLILSTYLHPNPSNSFQSVNVATPQPPLSSHRSVSSQYCNRIGESSNYRPYPLFCLSQRATLYEELSVNSILVIHSDSYYPPAVLMLTATLLLSFTSMSPIR